MINARWKKTQKEDFNVIIILKNQVTFFNVNYCKWNSHARQSSTESKSLSRLCFTACALNASKRTTAASLISVAHAGRTEIIACNNKNYNHFCDNLGGKTAWSDLKIRIIALPCRHLGLQQFQHSRTRCPSSCCCSSCQFYHFAWLQLHGATHVH